MRRLALNLGFLALLFIVSGMAAGCSSRRKVSTETSTRYSSPTGQAAAPLVVKEEKTVEKTESSETHSAGIVGTVFHATGQVLALPFRLVAGAIEFIF